MKKFFLIFIIIFSLIGFVGCTQKGDTKSQFIKDFDIDKIPINSSKVFKHDGSLIGIYKDEENNIHAVKPVCSHLGCLLSWNNTLKTWDCPCHGSRYDIDGNCVYGPSNNSLKKLDFE